MVFHTSNITHNSKYFDQKERESAKAQKYMGGISQDVKRQKKWDFYPLFFGFS